MELAARYGLPAAALRVSEILPRDSLQCTPAPEFVRWLAPRLARAGLVHAHMMGAWSAADHTPQARARPGGSTCFFAHGPAARAWAAQIGLDAGRLSATTRHPICSSRHSP